MKPHVPKVWSSLDVAAGTVSRNTKQGLLENQPAVEATGRGPRDVPPLSILILAFRIHTHSLAGKRETLLTFCCCSECYIELVNGYQKLELEVTLEQISFQFN